MPLDLAATILADTPSGRLYHALVPTKMASGVFGFTMEQLDPGLAMFGAQLSPGKNVDAALKTLTATLETLDKKPFTAQELERARSKWLTSWEQVYSDPEQVGVALSEAIAAGDWRLFFLQRDRARKATLGDVQKAATSYLVQSNRIEGRYLPTENAARAADAARGPERSVQGLQGRPGLQERVGLRPSPANIDKLTLRKKLDLPNGPCSWRCCPRPRAAIACRRRCRSSSAPRRTCAASASMPPPWLTSSTAARPSSRARTSRIAWTSCRPSWASGSGTTLRIAMSTKGENLPELTTLALDIVRNANFPKDQLEEYQRQLETSIRNAMTEPSALASRALARQDNPWPADDLRYVPTFDEALASARGLNRDALAKFHARFYGAGNIEYSAVGDFQPEAIEKAIKAGLAGWKRAPAYERVANPYREIAAQRFDIETPDKANAFYLSRMPLKLQDSDADYAALYLANYLFGASETSRCGTACAKPKGCPTTCAARCRCRRSSRTPRGASTPSMRRRTASAWKGRGRGTGPRTEGRLLGQGDLRRHHRPAELPQPRPRTG